MDGNTFRQRTQCRGVSAADVSPFQLIVGYESSNDLLRTMRTDLLLGNPDIVRNNLLVANGINLSHVDTLGLLSEWKAVFYDVRSFK